MAGNQRDIQVRNFNQPKLKRIRSYGYVRLARDETAQPNFMNKKGLPALPFRTDLLKADQTNQIR